MQIADLIGQYNNSLNAGSRIANGTKGLGQVADTMNKLSAGQLFEGTVTGMKGGEVRLSLSNGQAINARLAGDVNLIEGESVFFEVKSNDGGTINIRPVSMGTMNNPTLLSALDAAGLPVTEDSLSMVNAMMSEQMPIDSKALFHMAKLQNMYPNTDVSTLVTMTKLGIDVSPEMIEQFEHYRANEGAILDSVSDLADAFAETLNNPQISAEDVKAFQKQLLAVINPEDVNGSPEGEQTDGINSDADTLPGVLTEGGEGEAAAAGTKGADGTKAAASGQATEAPSAAADGTTEAGEGTAAVGDGKSASGDLGEALSAIGEGKVEGAEGTVLHGGEAEAAAEADTGSAGAAEAAADRAKEEADPATKITILSAGDDPEISKLVEDAGKGSKDTYPANSLGASMTQEEMDGLNKVLKDTGLLSKLSDFTDGKGNLRPEADAAKLLTALSTEISKDANISKEDLINILSSDGYKGVLKSALKQKWTLAPEEVANKENIKKLYEDLEKDVAKIAQSAADMAKGDNSLSQSARQVHNNIDFMNQVNQTYAYIQLPLKLSGQQTSGDLYVYSNKKRARGENDEISAFLHFDLDHLGSTDISVKMRNKKVDTKFFMADDAAFDLIEKNLPVLQAKLENMGYNVSLSVDGGKEPVNFVEDFLKQDTAKVGTITRYSFDMRA